MEQQADGIARVRRALKEAGVEADIRMMDSSTHTATQAADALGCALGQIAKTLVFMADGQPVLVIASGSNRVDVSKLEGLVGTRVSKADADAVRSHTGFSIGGVPPVGHPSPISTFIDEDLIKNPEVWAAGGHPSSLFPISRDDLVRITSGRVADLAER